LRVDRAVTVTADTCARCCNARERTRKRERE